MPEEIIVCREREREILWNELLLRPTDDAFWQKNNFAAINYYGYFKRVCVSTRGSTTDE